MPDDEAARLRRIDSRFYACGFDASRVPRADAFARGRASTVEGYRETLKKLQQLPVVEQKTPAWYERRLQMTSASDFGQALGYGKFGSVRDFLIKKVDPVAADTAISAAMASNPAFTWGNMFEPVSCAIYEKKYGVPVFEFGLLDHPTRDWFGASPDGITAAGVMLELKSPYRREVVPGGDIVPQYAFQVQGQMDVCGLDECDFFECRFDRCFDSREFTEVCGEFEHSGCIVAAGGGGGGGKRYLYSMDQGPEATVRWAKEKHDATTGIETPIYWVLRNYNIRRVRRDPVWLKTALDALERVWRDVLRYRKDPLAFQVQVLKEVRILDTEPFDDETSTEASAPAPTGVKAPWLFREEDDGDGDGNDLDKFGVLVTPSRTQTARSSTPMLFRDDDG
jgi:putative phage-type endonuclease